MYTSINHNLMAANTARNLNTHYANLANSTQRLSSGLRINSAADDAAGLAIRELQRAEIAALNQGVRNANDAISMIQVFDGALGIIDEKLVRMKELAEQAATGTYSSTQRLMIDSEFQAMASEIDRIARATDFNGIKMLNGPLGGRMSQDGMTATVRLRSNDTSNSNSDNSATASTMVDDINATMLMHFHFDENIGSKTATSEQGQVATCKNTSEVNNNEVMSGNSMHFIGDGYTNGDGNAILPNEPTGGYVELPTLDVNSLGDSYTISLSVYHASISGGTQQEHYISLNGDKIRMFYDAVHNNGEMVYSAAGKNVRVQLSQSDIYDKWVTHTIVVDNGNVVVYQDGVDVMSKPGTVIGTNDRDGREYNTPQNNALGRHWWKDNRDIKSSARFTGYMDDLMINSAALTDDQVKYLYDSNSLKDIQPTPNPPTPPDPSTPNPPFSPSAPGETDIPDDVIRIHFGPGNDSAEDYYDINRVDVTMHGLGIEGLSIDTQDKSQKALVTINDAIVKKDQARAYYGAMQNRLENTVSNLTIQAENIKTAESRISDADIATEMTNFVQKQILAKSAVAMLSQANSMPQMAMKLISR